MSGLWQWLVPDLKSLPPGEQKALVDGAKKGPFATIEVVVLVGWMLVAFFVTQQILEQSTHENKLAFAVVTNLVITAPLMAVVFVPVYLRKVRRHIVEGLSKWRDPGR